MRSEGRPTTQRRTKEDSEIQIYIGLPRKDLEMKEYIEQSSLPYRNVFCILTSLNKAYFLHFLIVSPRENVCTLKSLLEDGWKKRFSSLFLAFKKS